MGKALYRKYRPCCLADVVGEEQVTEPLAGALQSGRFGHAYLFTGPRGCGKTSVARIFAHEVNQFKYEIEDEYIDIIEIDAASNTGVDNIRELREKACVVPSEGKYKIYIIDEVHMLSKSAFNALLKTLEEPPAHVIFIMATTDPEKVPVTILSRAQVYQFRLVDADIMQQHLAKIAKAEKIPIDDAALALIARRGGGSFRDSLSLLDQISTLTSDTITAELVERSLGLPADATIQNLLAAYRAADLTAASAALQDYYSTGGKAAILAEELIAAILAAPDPVFYHLLSTLTTVRDPFAEAKLLLCFMPASSAPAISTPIASTATPPTPTALSSNGVSRKNSTEASSATATPTTPAFSGTTAGVTAVEGHPENAPAFSGEASGAGRTPAPTSATAGGQQFDWQSYLDRVDADSARLRILLSQSNYDFDGHTLTIIPGNHQAAKAFARPADVAILAKHAQDYQLHVAEFGTQPASIQQSPAMSQISDIMGNIQELKGGTDDGGDPFQ